MDTVTFKVDKEFARRMEQAMKPLYGTKTEFIRAAIREKIEREKRKAHAFQVIDRAFGKAKTHTSDEEIHRVRERLARELLQEYGIDPDDPEGHRSSSGAALKTAARNL